MTFHFAWVDSTDTSFSQTYAREDEHVFRMAITQNEGEFASAELDILNPYEGLLKAGRHRWMWISWTDPANPSDGAQPLFFGRIDGVPEQMQRRKLTINFTARPTDYDTQKRALAETLKVAPYWDPVWIDPDSLDDPDAVFEARTQLIDVDRVTLALSAADVISGDDGTLSFDGTGIIADSVDFTFGAAPLVSVSLDATVFWDQVATGTLDVAAVLGAASKAAGGSNRNTVQSYTGGDPGLSGNWPKAGKSVGSGWSVDTAKVKRWDGSVVAVAWSPSIIVGGTVMQFPLWTLKPTLVLAYDADRQRTEKLSFTLTADVQEVETDAGDAEVLSLSYSSGSIDDPVDPADSDNPDGTMPIGDTRRASYFLTDRGRQSLEYLVCVARAKLLLAARTGRLSFATGFSAAIAANCRKSATVTDTRLPGGAATGKIVGYELTADGSSGQARGRITLGVMVGNGNSVAELAGTADYVDDSYVDDDYQVFVGQTTAAVAGEVTWEEFADQGIDDDGIDFFNPNTTTMVSACEMVNGVSTQEAVISAYQGDTPQNAAEAVKEAFSEIILDMVPLNSRDFSTVFAVTVSELMVPMGIDLSAGSA